MATTDRFHPAAPDGFALAAEEEFWPGIARLAVVQLETVVVALKGREALDEAVHQTRKATKRVRALLRLVRPTIGEGVYRRENRLLRDAARCLAPLRDDRVMVETVAVLRDGYARSPAESVFGELEQRLASRADRRAQVLVESGVVESAVATFEAALDGYRRWQMDPSTAVPIRVGVGAIYRRGREEMAKALATGAPHDMHAWRKRVKYLRHQIEVVTPAFPEVPADTAVALDQLGELLGADHDLAELAGLVGQSHHLCPDPLERSLLFDLVRHRRSEILRSAAVMGRRLFAEEPEEFSLRIALYWEAGQLGGR